MLQKLATPDNAPSRHAGVVLTDRRKIGEYFLDCLNEGRFGAPIDDSEIDNVLLRVDEVAPDFIETPDEDREIEILVHLEKYYPDTAPPANTSH